MTVDIQKDMQIMQKLGVLDTLLEDRTTGKHIVWSSDADAHPEHVSRREHEMMPHLGSAPATSLITIRAQKGNEQQSARTERHGEVPTPLQLCKKMCDYADTYLKADASWQQYVDARVLEITCGEAPFLASRYDMTTGEMIPVAERYGLLDRKLQVISENAQIAQEWLSGATRAFQAAYAYELQADNLLIARINLLMSFCEHMQERWKQTPDIADCKRIADIIAWNIWQMDGLTGTVPCEADPHKAHKHNKAHMGRAGIADERRHCCIRNWTADTTFEFALAASDRSDASCFALAIGNPPYQAHNTASTRRTPIYNGLMDATYPIADTTVLVTPARFLFDAGHTPKEWNHKMLADPHFCVLEYIEDTAHIFPSAEIRGGVAVTLHDNTRVMEPIKEFIRMEQMRYVVQKVTGAADFVSLSTVVSNRGWYRFSDQLYADFPDAAGRVGKGTGNQIVANIFSKNPDIFDRDDIEDGLTVLGRLNMKRTVRHIDRKYVQPRAFLDTYNVLVPEANNTGSFGEALSTPVIAPPGTLCTDTFICIGQFASANEAQNLRKYLATKFVRALLGLRKVTQHNPAGTWAYIPMQDFSAASALDWLVPIAQLDAQLYAKYGLSDEQIRFIEANVVPME